MMLRNTPVILGALAVLSLGSVGCATKKHVREAIAPVQNQVNDVQKNTEANKQAIGDLDRQVATADEKAMDAGKKAADAAAAAARANSAAEQANSAATQAGQRADTANSAAQQAQQGVARHDQSFQNLDNYRLVTTEQIMFPVNRASLTKEDRAKLDEAVQRLKAMKNYVVEVEGFADRNGGKAYNLELSRKRADAVVHYLAVENSIPLRSIRQLGAGSDFPNADNKTRKARKENRRVDVKVYELDLGGKGPQSADASNSGTVADRAKTPDKP